MTTKDLSHIPDAELAQDYAESECDLELCQRALAMGIETYFNGQSSVQDRIIGNRRIMARIRLEQTRRQEPAGGRAS